MQFGGRYRVSAHRDRVWAALNDTAVLKATIPGCKRIDWTSPDSLEIEISVNLGVMHPSFTGDLELQNVDPARAYRLSGRGRGGILGKAEAAADVTLADGPDGSTILAFSAEGGASGQIMKFGKALLGDRAQGIIDGFFARFGDAMGAQIVPLSDPATG